MTMLRPSLILATLVALLLSVSGAAPPAGPARHATSTRPAGTTSTPSRSRSSSG